MSSAASLVVIAAAACGGDAKPTATDSAIVEPSRPVRGGRLVVALGADPTTFNPLFATDRPSTEVVRRMTADLVHINRSSQKTENALAESWTISEDGKRFSMQLRRGVKFSDGEPFDADDVVFTFNVIQDEAVGSPNRDLLVLDGEPVKVRKIDSHSLEFELSRPHAVGARIFDSVPVLPSHLLEASYRDGTLNEAWRLDTAPEQIAGLGPFRLRSYEPGHQLVLERNPHFWKADGSGTPLPYLDELVFQITGSQESQVFRFRAGETDAIDDLKAADYAVLESGADERGYRLFDLGAGLDINFVFFNLSSPEDGSEQRMRKARWLHDKSFRQAVSAVADREGIARLVYQGRATPIWSHVSPGNKAWFNDRVPRPARSIERARETLRAGGYAWDGATLIDPDSVPVSVNLVTNSNNGERVQMMTILQEDLRELGIEVQVVPLEFGALLDRIFQTRDYDLCILGVGGGDADPNPMMNVLLSSGATHLWNPGGGGEATGWQAEIDRLMNEQGTELDFDKRKAMYDRVQEILADELPMVPLVSANVLVGAKSNLGNFAPAILDHHTLWNVDELYWGAD